ncbi:MAG: matrixin family metalloprotease [Nanoarchaeota archaeon]|nr:matrixin family metalloprotease [Nanoarchaeota archaeon]MBU1051984.1 matrixin family metalloprotease [Nanoarchaeota archaeon]MBU1988258.1 matrixin family metalloprotease [Nanoarchaeota archaeon]
MRVLDFFILLVLFIFLAVGMYFLWLNFPYEATEFERYVANISSDLPFESSQFHPNMRYPDKKISYFLSSNCSRKKQNDFLDAVELLERETILSFYVSDSPDIWVRCSNIAPKPSEAGHFVAGEGGPKVIINASKFAVIIVGEIALYRPETCDTPQVAAHELLHALGFDHNGNPESIMFEVTNCEQQIDRYIIDEIERLYIIPSAADLIIEDVKANKTGRYLNFEAVIVNYGLKGVNKSSLDLITEGSVIKTFDTEGLDIGSKKSLKISNLKIPRKTDKVTLVIQTEEPEIDGSNNIAEISVVEG